VYLKVCRCSFSAFGTHIIANNVVFGCELLGHLNTHTPKADEGNLVVVAHPSSAHCHRRDCLLTAYPSTVSNIYDLIYIKT